MLKGKMIHWLGALFFHWKLLTGILANVIVGIIGSSLGFWLAGLLGLLVSPPRGAHRVEYARWVAGLPDIAVTGQLDRSHTLRIKRDPVLLASALAVGLTAWLLLVMVPLAAAHEVARAVSVEWKRQHIERVIYFEGVPNSGAVPYQAVEIGGQSCIKGQHLLVDISNDLDFGNSRVELGVKLKGGAYLASNPVYQSNPLKHKRIHLESSDLQEMTVTVEGRDLRNLYNGRADILFSNRDEPFTLCDLRLLDPPPMREEREEAQLTITIDDDGTGEATPARLGIFDAWGRPVPPGGNGLLVSHWDVPTTVLPASLGTFWPAPAPSLIYIDGWYQARLPAGEYTILVMRGPEYRVYRGTVSLEVGAKEELVVPMRRWIDQAVRGWHSGDVHVHIGRNPGDDSLLLTWMKAEDLRVTNLLQMGNLKRTYFRQYAWGDEGTASDGGYLLVPGQEDPRTAHRGHILALRLEEPIRLEDSYFLYHLVLREAHRQGGITGYAHFGSYFNARRGLFLDVPFGDVDFVEILQFGRMETDPWYEVLNMGFRLAPAGGSDFPYGGLPGTARTYVRIEGAATPEAWSAGLAQGRTFTTNGPLLEFEVDGQGMGSEISLSRDDEVYVRGTARVNPDLGRLDRVELVANGRVIRSFDVSTETVSFDESLKVKHSMWLALRASGQSSGGQVDRTELLAHSGPIYLTVDGGRTGDPCLAKMAAQKALDQLDHLAKRPIDPSADWEAFETSEALTKAWTEQKPRLENRIRRAKTVYEKLLRDAERKTRYSPLCWFQSARRRLIGSR